MILRIFTNNDHIPQKWAQYTGARDIRTCMEYTQGASSLIKFHLSRNFPKTIKLRNSLLFCLGLGSMREKWLQKEFPWLSLSSLPAVEEHGSLVHAGHSNWVLSCAYSREGEILVSSSDDCTVRIWETRTGLLQNVLEQFSSSIKRVAFSATGYLASMENDIIKIWDSTTFMLYKSLPLSSSDLERIRAIGDIDFSPDGSILAALTGSTIILWNTKSFDVKRKWSLDHQPQCLRFLGNAFLVTCSRYIITIRRLEDGSVFKSLEPSNCRFITSMCTSPDSKRLAAGFDNGILELWNISSDDQTHRILSGPEEAVSSISFSWDNTSLASSHSQKVLIWDLRCIDNNRPKRVLQGHTSRILSACFSPNGHQAASTSCDQDIRLWNLDDEQETVSSIVMGGSERLSDFMRSISCIRVSEDGNIIASGSIDGSVCLWSGQTGKKVRSLGSHDSSVLWLFFADDGKSLGSTSLDKKVIIWDTETNKQTKLLGHTYCVRNAVFSPSRSLKGQFVASASDDRTVRLWNVKNFESRELGVLVDHHDCVSCVAFSSDGRCLASAGNGPEVIVWDLNAKDDGTYETPKKPAKRLEFGCSRAFSVAFCPDKPNLIASTGDGLVIWDIDSQARLQTIQSQPLLSLQVKQQFPNWIFTEKGTFRFKRRPVSSFGNAPVSEASQSASPSPSSLKPWKASWTLSPDQKWIKLKRHNVIFLPEQYRPSYMECGWVHGHAVAIGSTAARLLLLKFAEDANPLVK